MGTGMAGIVGGPANFYGATAQFLLLGPISCGFFTPPELQLMCGAGLPWH